MLSLPTITPRADFSLWPSVRNSNQSFDSDPQPDPPHPSRRHNPAHGHVSSRSLFTQLLIDEAKQSQRNANIRHFGATWIRPPGVQKTYQAMIDEEKELREQEAIAAREQHMLDLAAAQQDAANAEEREANGEEEIEGERDLDDDVPEAESSESDVSASESEDETEEEEVDGDESRADVTFNEDSFIEGSMIEGRVGQLLAMEEASMEGSLLEHDMDDDIPEAGEYEHTDSSLLDSSDEDDGSFIQPGSRRSTMNRRSSGAARSTRSTRSRRSSGIRSSRRTSGLPVSHTHTVAPAFALGQLQARGQIQSSRLSFDLEGSSSILEGSSFLRSSPAAARGDVRARLFGARQQR